MHTPSPEQSATGSSGAGFKSKWCNGSPVAGERNLADDEAAEIFNNAHRIAARYFGEGVVELLQPLAQRVARAIIAGDARGSTPVAEEVAPWLSYPSILQAGWVDGRLQISGTVQLTDVRPAGEIAPGELDVRRRGRGDLR